MRQQWAREQGTCSSEFGLEIAPGTTSGRSVPPPITHLADLFSPEQMIAARGGEEGGGRRMQKENFLCVTYPAPPDEAAGRPT